MKTPTFREQYDKIVGAYLRHQLNPGMCNACFVGNLLNNIGFWQFIRSVDTETWKTTFRGSEFDACIANESNGLYTPLEIFNLEKTFLDSFSSPWVDVAEYCDPDNKMEHNESFENQIFYAMEVTLLALRQLHESKGEIIEDYVFEKRQLINV